MKLTAMDYNLYNNMFFPFENDVHFRGTIIARCDTRAHALLIARHLNQNLHIPSPFRRRLLFTLVALLGFLAGAATVFVSQPVHPVHPDYSTLP